MKRDFLKSLGIEDKELIDKILDENSADIGRAKGETDDLKAQVTQLQSQLNKKTSEYDSLKESTKDYESLTGKINQLELDKAQLTQEKAQLTVDLDTKLTQLQKTHDTENKVRDRKAKNVKAVMALLDPDKDTDEQLDALIKGEDTAFLFGDAPTGSPTGTSPNNPPTGGNGGNPPTSKTFADAVFKALGNNN